MIMGLWPAKRFGDILVMLVVFLPMQKETKGREVFEEWNPRYQGKATIFYRHSMEDIEKNIILLSAWRCVHCCFLESCKLSGLGLMRHCSDGNWITKGEKRHCDIKTGERGGVTENVICLFSWFYPS
jgi:hypothetical protein